MSGAGLTNRQRRFVEEYLVDLNATQAAIRAGYSAKTAKQQGQRLLTNVDVQAAIQQALKARSERTEITQDMVLRELAKIGFADMRKLLRWSGNDARMDMVAAEDSGEVVISVANLITLFDSDSLDDDIVGAISEISQTKDGALKVKLHDKQAALVNIGKHLGMFKERVEHTGKDGGPIQHEQVIDDAASFRSRLLQGAATGAATGQAVQTQH